MQARLHHQHEEHQEQSRLCAPDQLTADKLWYLIVSAMVFILIGTFLALTASIFLKIQNDLLLTIFTSALTFLAGLVTPTPLGKGKCDTK